MVNIKLNLKVVQFSLQKTTPMMICISFHSKNMDFFAIARNYRITVEDNLFIVKNMPAF